MKRTHMMIAAAAALIATPICLAQAAAEQKTLEVGDKAPAIDVEHWIKGDNLLNGRQLAPVTEFENGNVYVLEFWATWCGPCKVGMPHITDLQAQYRDYDVTIIGISDEPLPIVVDFLFKTDPNDGKTYQQRTGYTLATDPDRSVFNDYMRAAGQNGIPTAFIIGKDGHVEWIGHPMRMDSPLEAVVRDSWDRDAFAAEFSAAARAQRAMQQARRQLATARQAEDWEKVLSIYNDVLKDNPNAVNYQLEKFMLLLKEMNRPTEAYALGEKIVEANNDNAMLLNQVAWFVVDEPGIQRRNLLFAMNAAERANALTESKDAAILDTVARVYFELGDLSRAIKYQTMAVAFAPDNQMGTDIRATLKRYEKLKTVK